MGACVGAGVWVPGQMSGGCLSVCVCWVSVDLGYLLVQLLGTSAGVRYLLMPGLGGCGCWVPAGAVVGCQCTCLVPGGAGCWHQHRCVGMGAGCLVRGVCQGRCWGSVGPRTRRGLCSGLRGAGEGPPPRVGVFVAARGLCPVGAGVWVTAGAVPGVSGCAGWVSGAGVAAGAGVRVTARRGCLRRGGVRVTACGTAGICVTLTDGCRVAASGPAAARHHRSGIVPCRAGAAARRGGPEMPLRANPGGGT